MRPRTAAGILASVGLMLWNPLAFAVLGIAGTVVLAGKIARRLGQWNRRRQVLPERPIVIYDWQLQHIPIEQRDWARRNLR